jgi:hypothetical protein
MKQTKLGMIIAVVCSALVGCGGDEGDDVSITNNTTINNYGDGTPGPTPTPSPTPAPTGDCATVVEADFVSYNTDCSVATLEGTILEDFTLTSNVEWRLDGEVIVGDGNQEVTSDADVQAIKDAGVALTIQPGTNIKAFDDGSLIVTRGSQLIADGTMTNPITFSSLDSDFDDLGEWGGVIIQGFAPQYGAGGGGACFGTGTFCNVEGEGGTIVGRFGGNEVDDNSGIIRYVRIAEGGRIAGPNNEVNGLTLQGVGYGTVVEYVQVHGNLDDGVEWFGGTVDARYLVLTNNDDDDIDFDEGYQGNIQYAIIQKHQTKEAPTGSNDPRGIEANSSDDEYAPETNAVLANITVLGGTVNNVDGGEQPGMRLRGALTVAIHNTAVKGWDEGCIRIDDADIDGDDVIDEFSDVTLQNILADCSGGIYTHEVADSSSNVTSSPFSLNAFMAIQEDEARLGSAQTINSAGTGSGFVFDNTDYIGAVDPDAAAGWWEGWTLPGTLNEIEPVETGFSTCNDDLTVCTLSGTIDEDYRLLNGVEWVLDGEVIVGTGNQVVSDAADVQAVKDNGVTLTIDAGVHVRAEDDGSLIVTRGSVLEAVGTPAAPITFSSRGDDDFDGLGEWGGVIIQGFAPQYGAGGGGACFGTGTVCNVEGEGGTIVGRFGGNEPDDYSGTLRYIRIAEGGRIAGPNNEVNGLTLQGVGHATTVEYIHVHNNLDDGVEWFGGTVNARYLVLTGNDDDDIDFDEGYQGNIQYAIVRKDQVKTAPSGSNDPRGIEANSSDDEYAPETNATLANILVLGGPVNNAAGGEQPGMRLRGALTTAIYNTAVNGFDEGCIRIDDADINGDDVIDELSDVTLVNVLGDCAGGYYTHEVADSETNATANAFTLNSAYGITNAEGTVAETNPVEVDNGSGFTFDNTTYVGAVDPATAEEDAWWNGWIIEGALD